MCYLSCLFRGVYLSYAPFWILMCCSLDDMEKVWYFYVIVLTPSTTWHSEGNSSKWYVRTTDTHARGSSLMPAAASVLCCSFEDAKKRWKFCCWNELEVELEVNSEEIFDLWFLWSQCVVRRVFFKAVAWTCECRVSNLLCCQGMFCFKFPRMWLLTLWPVWTWVFILQSESRV